MAISVRRVEGSFSEALFDFISGHEGFTPGVYCDARGIPLLCTGHAMLANTPGWPPCDSLERNLAAIGITLTPRDRVLLIDIGEALSCHDHALARDMVEREGFSFTMTRLQARALFERTRPDVEMLLQHKLGRALMMQLHGSREMIALLSLANDDITAIGPDLVAALQDGAREEVWYLIRFASNRGNDAKVQRRRDREAECFGLIGDPPQKGERMAVAELLASRRAVMKRQLEEAGADEAAARAAVAACYRRAGLDLPPCLRKPGEVQAAKARPHHGARDASRRHGGCEPGSQRCDPALVD